MLSYILPASVWPLPPVFFENPFFLAGLIITCILCIPIVLYCLLLFLGLLASVARRIFKI